MHIVTWSKTGCDHTLTTLVLVKVMKVNFPFPLSVHHVAEELFIIQQAILVFVIRINDILGGQKGLW